jgi:hypothetical protein
MVTTQLCNLVDTVKIVSDIIQELLFYVKGVGAKNGVKVFQGTRTGTHDAGL